MATEERPPEERGTKIVHLPFADLQDSPLFR
jgi:hypothetical protein